MSRYFYRTRSVVITTRTYQGNVGVKSIHMQERHFALCRSKGEIRFDGLLPQPKSVTSGSVTCTSAAATMRGLSNRTTPTPLTLPLPFQVAVPLPLSQTSIQLCSMPHRQPQILPCVLSKDVGPSSRINRAASSRA